MIPDLKKIKDIVNEAKSILIIQADNPDGDSLASSLALEHILGDYNKTVSMFCGVDMPHYIKHMPGWDRVSKIIPQNIDASIIVDTSAKILLERLENSPEKMWVASKPVIVLDHHSGVTNDIPYATITVNEPGFVSTGELIYDIAKQSDWPISIDAMELLMLSILSDTLGLITEGVTSNTYRRLAEMVDAGVDRPKLEEARKALSKMEPVVFQYKAELIKRTEFYGDNNEIAIVSMPEDELFTVGTLYNPAPLILGEMTMIEGVQVGIALKRYQNKVTGSIRCTNGKGIAHLLAESFGGGGHPFAAGFKIENPKEDFADLKSQIISKTNELLK